MASNSEEHRIGYGAYALIWLSLLSLMVLTVATAGLDLSGYSLFVTLLIAGIKAGLVINIFMHIKFLIIYLSFALKNNQLFSFGLK